MTACYLERNMDLSAYIKEQKSILKSLGLYKYVTKAERQQLEDCKTEIQVDNLTKTYRHKYYDIMLEDYDKTHSKPKPVAPKITKVEKTTITADNDSCEIVQLNFSRRTTNALLRNHIFTIADFIDFINDKGWSRISTFGCKCAEEVLGYILGNVPQSELDDIVEKTKDQRKSKKIKKEED